MYTFFVLIFSLVCGATLTAVVARYLRVIDQPNHRSSHDVPTPRSGGVAIVITWLLGFALMGFDGATETQVLVLLGVLVAALSLWDDIYSLSAMFRLLAHALVALTVVILIGPMQFSFGSLHLPYPLAALLTLFWVVGMINAVNFVDGIDGLIGLTTAMAALAYAGFAYSAGAGSDYAVLLVLSMACLGFLFFNWHPATIFMGDVGSAFLGFVLAGFAIIGSIASALPFWLMPLLLFSVIYDAAFTFTRRGLDGKNLAEAHREHLYQLLVRSGYSHRRVTVMHGIFTLFQIGMAWIAMNADLAAQISAFFLVMLIQLLYTRFVWQKAGALVNE